MLARIAVASFALATVLQAQLVEKLNGPLAGDVSTFTWTPDGRYVLYGAERYAPDIDVVTSLRLSDGAEAVYAPYQPSPEPGFSASTHEFVFLPDPELAGVYYGTRDFSSYPPITGSTLHVFERFTALRVTTLGRPLSPCFLDDGRVLFRTSFTAFRGSTYESGYIGRWDSAAVPLEISPPVQPDNHVSQVLPATHAGVAVFGWRDTIQSSNNAELLAVPLGGGAWAPLTPPPAGRQREWVDALHVRSSDELVIYSADEDNPGSEFWAVPVDGSLPPRRLNPPLSAGRRVSDGKVTADETHLVFRADIDVATVYELWSADLDDGTSQRLSGPMTPDGDVDFGEFWIAPDSAHVVYRADQSANGVFELYSAPIDGGTPAVRLHAALPTTWDALETVHFTPDGSLVVFAVQMPRGIVLLAAPVDGSFPARALNWPFPQGGGVPADPPGILFTVAIAPGGRNVFFLGEQDVDDIVELYSAPIDGSAPPRKWNAPLVAGGDVTAFAVAPRSGAVLYRADQDVDERFELFLSALPAAPPPHAPTGAPTPAPTRSPTRTIPGTAKP